MLITEHDSKTPTIDWKHSRQDGLDRSFRSFPAGVVFSVRGQAIEPVRLEMWHDKFQCLLISACGSGSTLQIGTGSPQTLARLPVLIAVAPDARVVLITKGRSWLSGLHLDPEALPPELLAPLGAKGCVQHGEGVDRICAGLMEEIGRLCEQDFPHGPALLAALGPAVLLRLVGPKPTSTGALPVWRLRKVDAHITEHLSATIRLTDLATAAGFSSCHFSRAFRQTVGQSPGAYLRTRRCAHARLLLAETGLSLTEIALACGFASQSHFSTVFHRLEGLPPAQWRARLHGL